MDDLLNQIAPLVNSSQFQDLDSVGKADFREKAFGLFLSQDPQKAAAFQQLKPEQQDLVRDQFVGQVNQRFPDAFTTGGFVYENNGGLVSEMPTKVPILDPHTERFLASVAPQTQTDEDGTPKIEDSPNMDSLASTLKAMDPATRDQVSALVRTRFGDQAPEDFTIPDSITVDAGSHPVSMSAWSEIVPTAVRTLGALGAPAAADALTDGLAAPTNAALAAGGAAVAEPFAQWLEKNVFGTRAQYSAEDAGINVAAAAIPGAAISEAAPLAGQVLGHAAVGAAVGAGQETAHEAVDQGKLDPASIAQAGGVGAVVGGILGGAPQAVRWMTTGSTVRQDLIGQLEGYAKENGYAGGSQDDLKAWYRSRMPGAQPAEPVNVTGTAEPEAAGPAPAAPEAASAGAQPAEVAPAAPAPAPAAEMPPAAAGEPSAGAPGPIVPLAPSESPAEATLAASGGEAVPAGQAGAAVAAPAAPVAPAVKPGTAPENVPDPVMGAENQLLNRQGPARLLAVQDEAAQAGASDQEYAAALTKAAAEAPAEAPPADPEAAAKVALGPDYAHLVDSFSTSEGDAHVAAGIKQAAPDLLTLRGTDYDLAEPLGRALAELPAVRASGMPVEEYLAHAQTTEADPAQPESDFILANLAQAKNPEEVGQFLRNYALAAQKGSPDVTDATVSSPAATPAAPAGGGPPAPIPGSSAVSSPNLTLAQPATGAPEPHAPAGHLDAGGARADQPRDQAAVAAGGNAALDRNGRPGGAEPATAAGDGHAAAGSDVAAGGAKPPVVPPPPGVGGELGDPDAPENSRTFSQLPIELPEMVQLAKALLGGQYPKVLEHLRALRGNALGLFKVRNDFLGIELRADIFDLVQPAEKQALKEQAAAYAINLHQADPTIDRAAAARERYEELLGKAYDEAKLKNPVLASKVLAHEIGHLDDWLPQHAMPKGSIFAHIAQLKQSTKTLLADKPANWATFTQADRVRLRVAAERMNGPEPKEGAAKATWKQSVQADHQRLIDFTLRSRGLVKLADIQAELRPLIAWWRGTPTMEKYFEPAEEMYAEAFSVVMNNPAALEKRAPKFTSLFYNYLGNHPETQIIYGQIQNMIKSGAIARQRVFDLREGFRSADQAGIERQNLGEHKSWPEIIDDIRAAVDSSFAPIYRRLKANPDKSETDPVFKALSDYMYRTSAHELFLRHLNNRVLGPLEKQDLDWTDLGEYMFHTHVIANRANIANSQGWNPRASRQRLLDMAKDLGPQRFKALEEAQKSYRSIYENEVIAPLKAARVLDAKLMKVIEDRSFYATMSANLHPSGGIEPDTIEAALINRYGPEIGSKIYRQVGFLGDVKNPATATAQKAVSLISMAYREGAKRSVVGFLLRGDDPLAREADSVWTGRGRQPVQVNNNRIGTLMFLHQGKLKAYYVPRAVADAFKDSDAVLNRIQAQLSKWVASPIKSMWTHLNYGFWPVQAVRNARAFARYMPQGGLFLGKNALISPADALMRGRRTLLGESLRAAQDLAAGCPNPVADAALMRRMIATRVERHHLTPDDDAFEQLVQQYGLEPRSWEGKILEPAEKAMKLWLAYARQGQVIDRAFRIAGMLAVDKAKPNMSEADKAQLVQERAGGAKYREAGHAAAAIETIFPFYNAWKQHAKAAFHAWTEDPADQFGRYLMYVGAGVVAGYAAEKGLLDRFKKAKEFGEMLRSVPEYDKARYSIIPLAWTDRKLKKVLYLRLPMNMGDMFEHSLTRAFLHLLHGDRNIQMPVVSYAADQTPGLNPLIDVGRAWWEYKIEGRNPYDDFRGTNLLPPTEYQAYRGQLLSRLDLELGKWSANELGAGLVGRFTNPNLYSTDGHGIEGFLQLPFVSNTVGRFLKVSNRGAFEAGGEIEAEFEQTQAQIRVAADDMLQQIKEGHPLTQEQKSFLTEEPYAMRYLVDKYPSVMAAQLLPPEAQQIMRAPGLDEKAAIIRAGRN